MAYTHTRTHTHTRAHTHTHTHTHKTKQKTQDLDEKSIQQKLHEATNPSGLAVIMSNDYIGTPNISALPHIHSDGRAMEEAFNGLNFVTHWGRNLTRDQSLQLISSIRSCQHPHSHSYKCIAVVYSGHGGAGDVLLSQDGCNLCVKSELMEALTNDPKLAHIPKLFFIDACRGSGAVTVVYGAKDAGGDEFTRLQVKGFHDKLALLEGNFLVGYATIDLKLSYLDKHGSVWMQMLASELKSSCMTLSIQDIMATTTKKLMKKYSESAMKPQQPETVDRLNCGPLHLKKVCHQDNIVYTCIGYHYALNPLIGVFHSMFIVTSWPTCM